MNAADTHGDPSTRVLLLLPTHRDALLTCDILEKNGLHAVACDGSACLMAELDRGAGAVLVAEEWLAQGVQARLVGALERQPRWSDLPILVLTRSGADSQQVGDALAQLGNVTLLERPLRLAALVSAARTALRARERQYQIRSHLDELERTRDALAVTARRKDEFLAMLGHELRNPLAPIRNALHLLGTPAQSSADTEQLRSMLKRQVDHMVRLVDDLVEVSRLSRGTIDLRRERIALAGVLRNAVELSRPLIEAGQHELVLDIDDEALHVDADPVRLAQVFGNLLNNAAKYATTHGRITVRARRAGDAAVVSVIDQGIGIEPEMLPHVFELFTQGRRDAHRAQDGLGIGLTLVRSLVEMHGGTVSAASEGRGRGSQFVVRLPLVAAPSLAEQASTLAPAPGAHSPGLRVLVVDDNVDAARSLGMVLELMGIEYEVAYSGPAALDAAERFAPDAILLDIGMPGMDGYEVARRLRSQPGYEDTVLVAVTGWSQVQDQQRTRDAGFNHHFSKPADIGALQRLLAAIRPVDAVSRSAPTATAGTQPRIDATPSAPRVHPD